LENELEQPLNQLKARKMQNKREQQATSEVKVFDECLSEFNW